MKVHGGPLLGPGNKVLPLSKAIEIDGLVYLSGQLALVDGQVEGDITAQTHTTFDNIAAILQDVGLELQNIVKATVWLTDPADFGAFNAVYAARLDPPFPTRSCVISQLVLPKARVEIEVVASRNARRA
jgi:reactive intermediate/imine deaminase